MKVDPALIVRFSTPVSSTEVHPPQRRLIDKEPISFRPRGDTSMTSALGVGEGDTQKADTSTDELRECDSDKVVGGGKKMLEFWGRHMYMPL